MILVIALAVSTALAGTFWFTLGKSRAGGLGYAGIPAGFLTGFVLFLGLPPALSADPLHILPYVVLAGLLAGIIVDCVASVDSVRLAVVLGWPGLVVVAIGWREMPDFATFSGLPMAVLWFVSVLTYLWMGTEHRIRSAPVITLLAVTIGLGLTAFIGGSKILTVLAAILAVSFVGVLGWSWPNARFPLGGVANLGAGGSVLALAVTQVLYSNASIGAVAMLLLVFAMAPLAAILPGGGNPKAGPIVLLFMCVFPLAAAVAVALYAKGALF